MTPVKYKRDIQWLTCVLAMLKNEENNGEAGNGLSNPHPRLPSMDSGAGSLENCIT